MEDKVFCPWCGSEMELMSRVIESCGIAFRRARYKCSGCGAMSQEIEEKDYGMAAKIAYLAAQRRYTPPIKPLTLAEARRRNNSGEPLYVESNPSDPKGNLPPVNDWIVYFKWLQMSIAPDAEPYDYIEEGYGVSYRCWERKPTDEERGAAAWET